ncbi:MAG TPA: ATP-dependent RNA helicase HrpA [Verrucomicrobiae bacterium]|nr:ATP-dependent RNA helicase HrpA [Verrucomicrobiae bacterium]
MADPRLQELQALLPRCLLPDWVRLGSRLVRLLRDRHHPDTHDAILDRLLAQARASVALRERRRREVPSIVYPAELPITSRKDEIVAAIRNHQVVVIAGETGSGKTTQIPKMCLEAGLGIEAKIGCTQPRRLAALSISRRIAEELKVEWGRQVGCKIRFDDRSSAQTYIKVMTDGILLAETQGDPLLSEYNALIIDEAHERSLNIDFLLGHVKELLSRRADLKLIITSATIDPVAFSRAFENAPVLEVSGRLYPVEVLYAPFDAEAEETGEKTFVDAAVEAVERVLTEPGWAQGDVLVFMPGERDIREMRDLLDARGGGDSEIIPLFGRLSAGEQQRVFVNSPRRKIIIATNIAETSLTIPGIRYVIDTGLARISRYNPRTRTKRLPIEPVSQSSARQRQGRAGRVQEGVCIRLYAEADFAERPPQTQPEIQRANLAEVILRLKAFHLGEIETFPFLDPPTPAAIAAGYKLLQELGACDERRELTPLGRDLARLPIDPTLGRMLLQSQREHATRELLIIAAGLSIQDPRERPLDQKDAAEAAHRRFVDPQSDFLSLLNIWKACHEQWERLRTQNQRRKFCRTHFLSYTRMREWQDLHAQLHEALQEVGAEQLNEREATHDAVHRSILSGLLGHVACRSERNLYKACGNRQVMLFPGSTLFDRNEKVKGAAHRAGQGPESGGGRPIGREPARRQPPWIVAGEIVETSQIFARTVAGIDPHWIVELAPHLCQVSHQHPHWDAQAGRVLVEEKLTFYGLEVRHRQVAYGNINPTEATEIFIQTALLEEGLFPEPALAPEKRSARGNPTSRSLLESADRAAPVPALYGFLEHNRQVRQKIATWRTRVRRHDLPDMDRALFEFYAARLGHMSSREELTRWLGAGHGTSALCAAETDLIGGIDLNYDPHAFPDVVPLGGQPVALAYAYAPGDETDGVTVRLPVDLAQTVSAASLTWAVPGLREEQAGELLRALPRSIRRELMPLAPKIAEIVRDFRPAGRSLLQDLALFLRERYGVAVEAQNWRADALPAHLRPRIEIIGRDQQPLTAGRDLELLRPKVEHIRATSAGDSPDWMRVAQRWERAALTGWTFGDLPERITVNEGRPGSGTHPAELAVYAWPGLQTEDEHVSVRLFRSQEAERRARLAGLHRLLELTLRRELGWLQRDLRALSRLEPAARSLCSAEQLQDAAFEHLKRHLMPREAFPALTETHFQTAIAEAQRRLPGLAVQFSDRLDSILQLRQEILRRCGPASRDPNAGGSKTLTSLGQLSNQPTPNSPGQPSGLGALLAEELAALLPTDFLQTVSFEQLGHFPRYLKALLIRAERAALNPLKDQEKARRLAPYRAALLRLSGASHAPELFKDVQTFRWMIEEFKVSLFAQELGTAYPVSAMRLDDYLAGLRRRGGG